MDLTIANNRTEKFENLIKRREKAIPQGNLKVGVDLGTANIVIAVVDENNEPVAGVLLKQMLLGMGL